MKKYFVLSIVLFLFITITAISQSTIKIKPVQQAKQISPDLFGIFFEGISYAADGGLYAELVQNRSFEYSAGDNCKYLVENLR